MESDKKSKFDTILEDLTMASNNFAGSQTGQGSGMSRPKKMSVIDLITAQKDLESKQRANVGTLPYPLDTTVMDRLADAWMQLEDVVNVIKQTVNSPLITSDKQHRQSVKQLYKKCRYAQKTIQSCGDDLDQLLPDD